MWMCAQCVIGLSVCAGRWCLVVDHDVLVDMIESCRIFEFVQFALDLDVSDRVAGAARAPVHNA